MNPVSSFDNNINAANLSSTNYFDKFKSNQQPATLPKEEPDKIVISRDFIVKLKYNQDMAAYGTILEGFINQRATMLKVVSNETDMWCEGALDKKYFLFHSNKDKSYDGKYGDLEYNLTVDYDKPSKTSEFFNQKLRGKLYMPKYFTVKGTVGNRQIDITLPNAKIPEDKETQDLIAMILEDNGLKAQTVGGEVKSLKFTPTEMKNLKEKSRKRKEMIDQNIKPIISQGISTASGMVVGALVSALLLKAGLKH